ncbi:MAG: hypothetical protein M3Y59_12760 [Myxococcota bacterium]|nr:hypothetical protein [Myxococcota bacterium]
MTLLLAGACVWLACGHTPEPPPLQTVRFDRWVATYRAYTQGDICKAEPRWLFDELTSVNGALNGFVEAARPPEEGRYSQRQLKLLEEAPQELKQLTGDHLTNLSLVRGCSFAGRRGFPVILERGESLAREAQSLMETAPAVVERERALVALVQWRKDRQRDELSARLGCPARTPKRGSPLYHAYQDEAGRTSWLFCDGARVFSEGGAPTFEPPNELTSAQRRTLRPAYYLEAAKAYSPERISRPPQVPDAQSVPPPAET